MFLRHLLPSLVEEGHRVLLFSQSKVMLDLCCCLLSHLVRCVFDAGVVHAPSGRLNALGPWAQACG